jgi:hypothetical protein
MRRYVGTHYAYVLQVTVLLTAIYMLGTESYSLALSGFIAFGLTLVPHVMKKRFDITLPWEIYLLIALFLSLNFAGAVGGRYEIFSPYYDTAGHLTAGISVAVLAFVIVFLIDRFSSLRLTRMMIVYFIVLFTMGFGGIFEIYEFVFDTFFGTSLQLGLNNTMRDLAFDLVGAIIIALFGNFYLLRLSRKEIPGLDVRRSEKRNE